MCKSCKKEQAPGVYIDVNVTKIVVAVCLAAVCIVGIIFGTNVAKTSIREENRN